MAANLPKIVNIIETTVPPTVEELSSKSAQPSPPKNENVICRERVPRTAQQNEEILFAEPTFSERFMRYMFVIIYLCALCSLGFFLSIYYIFFWDSRMPPVFKPTPKKSLFIKT